MQESFLTPTLLQTSYQVCAFLSLKSTAEETNCHKFHLLATKPVFDSSIKSRGENFEIVLSIPLWGRTGSDASCKEKDVSNCYIRKNVLE